MNEIESLLHSKIVDLQTQIHLLASDIRGSVREVRVEPAIPVLQVKLLSPDAKVPTRGSEGAIGWDLYAAVERASQAPKIITFHQTIPPHERIIIPTGISIVIPSGHYGRVAPRSGLAVKQGIDVLAGVIDSDYRGEVKVILYNTTIEFQILDLTKPIAQLILERADTGVMMVVAELDETARGAGGFGSTDTTHNIVPTCAECRKLGINNPDILVGQTTLGNLCAGCYEKHKETL